VPHCRRRVLALRHQLTVLEKNAPLRLRLQRSDRLLWALLSRLWPCGRCSLHIAAPRYGDRLAPPSVRVVRTRKSRRTPAGGCCSRRRDGAWIARAAASKLAAWARAGAGASCSNQNGFSSNGRGIWRTGRESESGRHKCLNRRTASLVFKLPGGVHRLPRPPRPKVKA
jgi:hypothetical protein